MTTPTAPRPTAPASVSAPGASPAPVETGGYALSRNALRALAGVGFLLLASGLVLTAVLGLRDAIEGDGVGGPALTAGFWALGLGALLGAAALGKPRWGLVLAQYACALAAPFLAALD